MTVQIEGLKGQKDYTFLFRVFTLHSGGLKILFKLYTKVYVC